MKKIIATVTLTVAYYMVQAQTHGNGMNGAPTYSPSTTYTPSPNGHYDKDSTNGRSYQEKKNKGIDKNGNNQNNNNKGTSHPQNNGQNKNKNKMSKPGTDTTYHYH